MTKNMTYEEAMKRLETIVSEFERNDVALDELTTQLAEAQTLLRFCNEQLQKAEADVKKIIEHEQE